MKISIYVGFVLSLFHCRNIKFATDVIFTRKSEKTLFRELQDWFQSFKKCSLCSCSSGPFFRRFIFFSIVKVVNEKSIESFYSLTKWWFSFLSVFIAVQIKVIHAQLTQKHSQRWLRGYQYLMMIHLSLDVLHGKVVEFLSYSCVQLDLFAFRCPT